MDFFGGWGGGGGAKGMLDPLSKYRGPAPGPPLPTPMRTATIYVTILLVETIYTLAQQHAT